MASSARDLQVRLALALQLRAAADHLRPTHDSWLRYVFRWYSKTFSTPLHEVPDLPLQDILLAYFDEAVENMDPEAKADYFDELALSEEERTARAGQEDVADVAQEKFIETLTEEVKAGMLKGPPKKGRMRPGSKKLPDQKAPPPPPLPDIVMKFGDLGDDNLLEQDPLLPPPPKVK